jgi:antitoxin (DNA-binding transcriptional repressor) of toxin-antitoxin stability system
MLDYSTAVRGNYRRRVMREDANMKRVGLETLGVLCSAHNFPLVSTYCGQSVYNEQMGNRVIHISTTEAASDFAALLDHVRAGDEVVIEHDARPVAVLRPAAPAPSLDKAFAAITQDVPDEEWERVPKDLAKNLDHYLYGTSKVTS